MSYPTNLVDYLVGLVKEGNEDRGTLAHLRSGIGNSPEESTRMLPYVARFLRGNSPDSPQVKAVFLTASLFALHRKHAEVGNLGFSFRLAALTEERVDAWGPFLSAVIDAHPTDVPDQVTRLVRLCDSKDVPIDWYAFYRDIQKLLKPEQDLNPRFSVRLEWARSYWTPTKEETEDSEK